MKKSLWVLAALLAVGAAQAEDTLKKIKDTGTVTMGVRESSGLSYTIGDGKYVGFHIDVCTKVLSDIEKQLGKKIETKYQPVTSQNRIPLVQNGTVDIECGSTTNNATRQKDVAFAVTTYVEEVRIAVKANSGINSIKDLNGKFSRVHGVPSSLPAHSAVWPVVPLGSAPSTKPHPLPMRNEP